jgi:hypothetical protein
VVFSLLLSRNPYKFAMNTYFAAMSAYDISDVTGLSVPGAGSSEEVDTSPKLVLFQCDEEGDALPFAALA